ncbi:MAG: hypothetical protein RL208_263 [Pseudomonadota bacterium]|jgi:hypothetical protein
MNNISKKDKIQKNHNVSSLIKSISDKITINKKKVFDINSILNTIENEAKQITDSIKK